jgi:hypothetical protein
LLSIVSEPLEGAQKEEEEAGLGQEEERGLQDCDDLGKILKSKCPGIFSA